MTVSMPAGSALVVQVIVTGTAVAGGPIGATEIAVGHSGMLDSPFALNVTFPLRGIGPLAGVTVTVKSTASS